MRKHFLLLFLMALLPLAGWADAITFPTGTAVAVTGSYTYDNTDKKAAIIAAATVKVEETNIKDKVTLEIYTNAACTNVASEVKNAGDYWIQAVGDGETYLATEKVSKKFTVAKKTITITAKSGVSKTYGSISDLNDPDFYEDFSSQLATGDDAASAGIIVRVTLESGQDVGAHSFTLTNDGTLSSNYDLTFTNGQSVTVTKASLTVKADDKSKTYGDADPAITYTYEGFKLGDTAESIAELDGYTAPTISRASGETVTTTGYAYSVTAAGAAKNYEISAAAEQGKLTITKKNLFIITNSYEKVYKGEAYTIAQLTTAPDLGYQVQGLVENTALSINDTWADINTGDAEVSVSFTPAGATAVTPKDYAANGYKIYASATESPANYTYKFMNNGKLTIKKRPIVVKAVGVVSKAYGEAEPTFDFDIVAVGGNADSGPIADADAEITIGNSGNYKQAGKVLTTLPTVARDSESEAVASTYKIVPSGAVASNNYEISEYQDYAFAIIGSEFFVLPNQDITQVYGDEETSLEGKYTIYGVEVEGDEDKITVELERVIPETGELSDGKHVGVYTVKVKSVTLDESIAGNYSFDVDGMPTGKYTITARPITITANAQSMKTGTSVDDLNALTTEKFSYTNLPTGVTEIPGLTLKFTNRVIMNDENPAKVKPLADQTNKNAQNVITNAIEVVVAGVAAMNDYDVTAENALVKGNLTLIDPAQANLALSRKTRVGNTDTPTTNYAALAAVDGKRVDITISDEEGHKLQAGKWNTLVLPFEITVWDLNQLLQSYAIVNTLNQTTTSYNEVHFNLCMGTIEANTPFLIKTTKEVSLDGRHINNVLVSVPAGSSADEPVASKAAQGCTFYGTYNTTFLRKTNDKTWVNDKLVTGKTETAAETGATFLYPLAAYLSLDNADARIYIEDINEDGTTAIKTLNVETMKAYNVDGWYTLNGVKLQSVPTEKGVYINNGKKVVIK